ncbi:Antiseptic resistance protein [Nocardia cyriacigeorgica]|uniref:Antiseptic resistance protein n=2 Tax=Nocardia cyriacigeorgica TaxID=135487 RepID=A0A4U8W3A0_9NOCA|nr:Antiseptic resistance protein [Nocardia cyriacigeorgica]
MNGSGTDTVEIARWTRAEWWMLTVSCLAVALVVAAMAALYSALPHIAVATGATQAQLTWIVDGYTLVLACLVLPAGAVGDRYGRRAVLVAGLVVFAAASALPLLLDDPGWLIAARALAGAGAALVMPSTLSILTAGFAPALRGRAVGVWAGVAGSGAVLGILGAGVLLQRWSWSSVFVGLTVAGAVLAGLACTIAESRQREHPPVDWVGAAAVAVAVAAIVFASIEVPARGWADPLVSVTAGIGVAAAIAFVVVELRSAAPLLDVRLFARRGFGAGALSVTIQFLVTFGVFLLLVQYLQLILGFGPLGSALALAPMMMPLVVISVIAPWLSSLVGLRVMTVTGLLTIAAGLVLVSRLTLAAHYLDLLWPLLIMSAGLGLCTAPATYAIVADTPETKHGVAAAVNDAAREIGAAIGIAVAGSVLAAGYTHRIAPALPQVPEPARGSVADSLAAALQVADRAGPVAAPLAEFAKAAFVHGSGRAALTLAALTATAAIVLAILAPGRAHLAAGASVSPPSPHRTSHERRPS